MNGSEIRKNFVEYFEKKGHSFVASAPVFPKDDPTLLFTNAGMNQFKPIFLGHEQRDYQRAANYQKCIRVSGKHNDLEEVGKDHTHHTFFEMLGNWSFGDYFKKEAIVMAWEYLTEVVKLPKDRLHVTVYKDDDEAEQLWKEHTDVDPQKITRWGDKENFWEMGETGPCGPCSEIHFDKGEEYTSTEDPGCGVNCDDRRFCEIWNLVFIQYNRKADGTLEDLPAKHVDTGMGLERLASIVQGKDSNYETDLFRPLIEKIEEISGKQYDPGEPGTAFRVISDHVRAVSFAISDGALPSNDGRGYVLRRLLRRAARYGHTLDIQQPFIYKLVGVLIDIMGEAYPDLKEQYSHITLVIKSEEERFFQTLNNGITIFEKIIKKNIAENNTTLSGKDAFTLYDTYGFPIDLTNLMAEEKGMSVDNKDFEKQMQHQRESSRKAGKFSLDTDKEWTRFSDHEHSKFLGYKIHEIFTKIVRYIHTGKNRVEIILEETPFYAESGGQVSDIGIIKGEKYQIDVDHVEKTMEGIVHFGTLEGEIISPEVFAKVDHQRLKNISRHHTATHLLQAALRKLIGEHIHQAGSSVSSDSLRFDFTHFQALTQDEINEIEEEVNQNILSNIKVKTDYMNIDQAKSAGAMALFGEKYEEDVRVITIGEVSKELCGGIHCKATGEIGLFKIINETAVAAGVRRIEAKTGPAAYQLIKKLETVIKKIQPLFNTSAENLPEKIENKLEENKILQKQLEKISAQKSQSQLQTVIENKIIKNDAEIVITKIDVPNVDLLRQASDYLKNKLNQYIIVLAAEIEGKALFIASVDENLVKNKSIHAGKIVKEAASICQGGGGGKPTTAQAGGKNPAKINDALNQAKNTIFSWIDN